MTDRQLRDAVVDGAPRRAPQGAFEAAMQEIGSARQRPGWLVASSVGLGGSSRGALIRVGLAVGLLLVASIAAGLLMSGGSRVPITSLAPTAPAVEPLRTPAPARTPSHGQVPVLAGEPWILYERFTQFGGGLFVMRPDGTDSHQVFTDVPGVLKDADWSPDGTQVAFIDEQTEFLWIAGIDGSNEHRFAYCDTNPGCAHPAWSPDGTKIAFSHVTNAPGVQGPGAVAILVGDLATNAVTTVVKLERPLLADVPRWSPDGTELVFGVDQMDAEAFETGAAVAIVPVAGGEPRYLTPFDAWAYIPDWNRVDGRIVYSVQIREAMRSPVNGEAWDIYTLQADGTGLRQVTHIGGDTHLWFPTWTPDGTHILAADQARRLAVLVDPRTGEPTTIGGADLARPLWRPLP